MKILSVTLKILKKIFSKPKMAILIIAIARFLKKIFKSPSKYAVIFITPVKTDTYTDFSYSTNL